MLTAASAAHTSNGNSMAGRGMRQKLNELKEASSGGISCSCGSSVTATTSSPSPAPPSAAVTHTAAVGSTLRYVCQSQGAQYTRSPMIIQFDTTRLLELFYCLDIDFSLNGICTENRLLSQRTLTPNKIKVN